MRHALALLVVLPLWLPAAARADIPEGKIKIGVLQDVPEPYATETGNGAVVAAQMAAGDYETEHVHGDAEILAEVSSGGSKSDIDKVRAWLDVDHVAAVLSSAGPAVNRQVARMVEKRHVTLLIAATNQNARQLCSPNVVVWGVGPAARARALAQALVSRAGKRWFVMADQSPSGIAGQEGLQTAVEAAGGQVVGTLDHPVGEADMRSASSKVNQANAQVVALAEDDGDLITAIRSASLAGLDHRTTFAAMYARITDIDHAGPSAAQGVVVAGPFYWDTNQQTRRFALHWAERMQARHVSENAAAAYAATLSFLHAADAVDDIDARKVLPELRRSPIKDTLFGTVKVREDGRVVYGVNVYRVKSPDQIQQRWAYYAKLASVPGDTVFPPNSCHGSAAGKGS